MLSELTKERCEEILRRNRVCRIAIRDGDGTYIVPFSYAFADGYVYGHAPSGYKVGLLRQWPRVAILVDEIRNFSVWRSVMVRGEWEELTGRAELDRARALLLSVFHGELWGVGAGHGHTASLTESVLFRIRAEEVTGRSQNLA